MPHTPNIKDLPLCLSSTLVPGRPLNSPPPSPDTPAPARPPTRFIPCRKHSLAGLGTGLYLISGSPSLSGEFRTHSSRLYVQQYIPLYSIPPIFNTKRLVDLSQPLQPLALILPASGLSPGQHLSPPRQSIESAVNTTHQSQPETASRPTPHTLLPPDRTKINTVPTTPPSLPPLRRHQRAGYTPSTLAFRAQQNTEPCLDVDVTPLWLLCTRSALGALSLGPLVSFSHVKVGIHALTWLSLG
ncbi:hypothetical protein RHS01_07807 [Rhizoctonia solani]|uniref:Uncharacterized protein n=1 Tax=Rhizoctonia solani TaxID=456999 RepID=A0A8H7I804_9AGAM|nr:hypothetical protein RHS01_07807 [Rhizoctonia solani]